MTETQTRKPPSRRRGNNITTETSAADILSGMFVNGIAEVNLADYVEQGRSSATDLGLDFDAEAMADAEARSKPDSAPVDLETAINQWAINRLRASVGVTPCLTGRGHIGFDFDGETVTFSLLKAPHFGTNDKTGETQVPRALVAILAENSNAKLHKLTNAGLKEAGETKRTVADKASAALLARLEAAA